VRPARLYGRGVSDDPRARPEYGQPLAVDAARAGTRPPGSTVAADGGGHIYQYTAIALPEAKELLHEALDVWTATVHDVIDEFDGRAE